MNIKQKIIFSATIIWISASFAQIILTQGMQIISDIPAGSDKLFDWTQLLMHFAIINLPIIIIAALLFHMTRNR